ncbi:hypothetical protein, partial [Kocuria sp.]|nr:allantoinase AllB [Kocuria sp.]
MNATPHQGNKNTGDTKNNRPAEDTNQRTTDPQENAKRATESVQAKVAEAASNPEVNASPQDVAQENSQLAVTGERREEVESARAEQIKLAHEVNSAERVRELIRAYK